MFQGCAATQNDRYKQKQAHTNHTRQRRQRDARPHPTELDLPSDTNEDKDAAPPEPRRSPRLNRINFISQAPASVSQQALPLFTANAFLQELQRRKETKADPLNLEQVANGVVHPVTQETITKYKKVCNWRPLVEKDMDGSHGEGTPKISSGVQRHKRHEHCRIYEFGRNHTNSER